MRSQRGAERGDEPVGDRERAVLVEGAVIAEGAEKELQRLAFDDRGLGHVVDDEMGEIGLAGDRAERGELGAGEAHHVELARVRVRHRARAPPRRARRAASRDAPEPASRRSLRRPRRHNRGIGDQKGVLPGFHDAVLGLAVDQAAVEDFQVVMIEPNHRVAVKKLRERQLQ